LQRRERAAAQATTQATDAIGGVRQLAGGLVEQEHADVRGDRVESARVGDLRAALLGVRVEALDHVADEQRLAGDVGVVRARVDAGLDERRPVAPEGTGGRRYDGGARG